MENRPYGKAATAPEWLSNEGLIANDPWVVFCETALGPPYRPSNRYPILNEWKNRNATVGAFWGLLFRTRH